MTNPGWYCPKCGSVYAPRMPPLPAPTYRVAEHGDVIFDSGFGIAHKLVANSDITGEGSLLITLEDQ